MSKKKKPIRISREQLIKRAKEAWNRRNPNTSWESLTPKAREDFIQSFIGGNPKASNTDAPKSSLQRFNRIPDNQPFQGAEPPINRTEGFDDLGREDARLIRESMQVNPRMIDKPLANADAETMRLLMERQEALKADAQRQVFGEQQQPSQDIQQLQEYVTKDFAQPQQEAPLKSAAQANLDVAETVREVTDFLGNKRNVKGFTDSVVSAEQLDNPFLSKPDSAPEKPLPNAPLKAKAGAISIDSLALQARSRKLPTRRGSLAEVAVELAADALVQPASDFIFDNALRPLIGKIKGEDIPTAAKLREYNEYEQAYREKLKVQDALYETQYQGGLNELNAPIKPGEAPPAPVLPPPPQQQQQRQPVQTPIKQNNPVPTRKLVPTVSRGSVSLQSLLPQPAEQPSAARSDAPGANDSRNAEYIRRQAELGDNPTQEQMDELRDYGLQLYAQNFSK